MGEPRIVIAGGGVDGVAASRMLSAELGKAGVNAEVTLLSKEDKHYMPPLFFDVAMREASPEETYAPLGGLEGRLGVKVLVDPVSKIDAGDRAVVTGSGRRVEYVYLIIVLGTAQEWG